MPTLRSDFAEFYRRSRDDCLRAVLISVGDRDRAQDVPVPDPAVVADRAGEESPRRVDPVIMAALMRLPARQRQVIALRLILDQDTASTAQVLGITPNTVMVHMARALAALRADLTSQRQQEVPQ